jgi:hypothetical protein
LYPFERFSHEAKKVLTVAQAEAERAHHSYIGTEHLLIAICETESAARRALRRLGVETSLLRDRIESVLGRNERIIIQQIIPTSRVKKVIELAFEAARRDKSSEVRPDHLLVGLLEEGEGIAAHVLSDCGVTLAKVHVELARDVGEPVPGEAALPWPQPGARVLVHDPDPPYRLWEGTVVAHTGKDVTVSVPQHPERPEVTRLATELHGIPVGPLVSCERCRYQPPPAN